MNDDKLDFWIKNSFNVLMSGKHGVGKTARVLEAFKRNGLSYLYFSASTLDPWVDFIGVPKESVDDKGVKYLDLVRPKAFAEDTVQAIFLDEANRAPKKVRNAMMELIQFKSINGKKFNNLKIVWAAINPDEPDEDGELAYDVETLDPAQKDRFHIQVSIPYKPDKSFFKKRFGENGLTAVDWWNDLTEKVQNDISPRRLEYCLLMNDAGGDLRDILPASANTQKLIQELTGGSFRKNLQKTFESGDSEQARIFITNVNNYDNCIEEISKNEKMLELFLPHVNEERIATLMSSNPAVLSFVDRRLESNESAVDNALATNPDLVKQIKKKG